MLNWFKQLYPFPDVADILSLITSVVGDNTINCHIPKKIGPLAVNRIGSGDFQTVKSCRKNSFATCYEENAIPNNPTPQQNKATPQNQHACRCREALEPPRPLFFSLFSTQFF